jgi:hypothetical protein
MWLQSTQHECDDQWLMLWIVTVNIIMLWIIDGTCRALVVLWPHVFFTATHVTLFVVAVILLVHPVPLRQSQIMLQLLFTAINSIITSVHAISLIVVTHAAPDRHQDDAETDDVCRWPGQIVVLFVETTELSGRNDPLGDLSMRRLVCVYRLRRPSFPSHEIKRAGSLCWLYRSPIQAPSLDCRPMHPTHQTSPARRHAHLCPGRERRFALWMWM